MGRGGVLMSAGAAFEGFLPGQRTVSLPAQFFTEVVPAIEDADELRVTAYALYAIPRPGQVAARRASELLAEAPLARWFASRGGMEAGRRALDAAVVRGVLLALPLEDGDALLFVHTEGGRRLRERIAAGTEIVPGGARVVAMPEPAVSSRPAAVYEQEIGMLTPSVGAALAEAEQQYPGEWIVEALREAAKRNARSWNYAEAILRRWAAEGRDDEGDARHPGGRPPNPYDAVVRRGLDG
jgi:DNA replication protein